MKDLEIHMNAPEGASPAELEAYIDQACKGDLKLKARVKALFEAEADTGMDVLNEDAFDKNLTAEETEFSVDQEEIEGRTIGRYKLLEKLGEGGFGSVWAAEQQVPVKRRVALKVVKLGMDTKQVVARFEAERQALALMDHPNIAKVLDAGTTEKGRPFFVMELVKGIPITKYVEQENPDSNKKLLLFVNVCHAIQHAHQKGIIHRDIKPSNVMVTLHDGVPVPKVIDFGIAKATQGDLTDKTIYTKYHQFIGTPAYMSPEQAEMSGLDVDTRSDVYSLGVLLYELLTGQTPFDTKELLASGIDEMRKIIRERDPVKPSTRISQVNATSQTDDSPRMNALVSSDLDWIVMKCLEKDRTRRYDTANGLALDVKRHLNDEPILARPPSWSYRAQKAFQRNQLFCSLAAIFLVSLIVGSTVIGIAWKKESAARKAEEVSKGEALQAKKEAEISAKEANEARLAEEKKNLEAMQMVYAADMNLAAMALSEHNYGKARKLLSTYLDQQEPIIEPGWEWHYMWDQVNPDDALMSGAHHENNISGVAFLGDSERVISSSGDGSVKIWDLETGHVETLFELERGQVRTMAASKDGRFVGLIWRDFSTSNESMFGSNILNTRSQEVVGSFPATSSGNQHRTLSFINGEPSVVFNRGLDGWSIYNWEQDEIRTLTSGRSGPIALAGDGQTIALGSFRPIGNYQVIQLDDPEKVTHVDSDGRSDCVALSPNGELIAMGGWEGGPIRIVDLKTNETITTLTGHEAWVCALVFSHDGQRLYSASADQTIRIWNMDTHEVMAIYRGHNDEVWAMDLSADGTRLVTGSKDTTVRIWPAHPRVESDTLKRFIKTKRLLSYENFDEGRSAILAGKNRNEPDMVYLFEVGETRRLKKRSIQIPGRIVLDATITQDLKLVMKVRERNGSRRAFMELMEVDLLSGEVLQTAPFEFRPSQVAGQIVAGVLIDNGKGELLRLDQMHGDHFQHLKIPKFPVRATQPIAISPNPSVNQIIYKAYSGELFLHDLDTGELKTTQAHKYSIKGVDYSPDGNRIYSAALDGFAKCWNAHTLELIGEPVRPQLQAIFDIEVSPDGSRFVTCGDDGRIGIFDAISLRELGALYQDDRSLRITRVMFLTNEYLLSASSSTTEGISNDWQFHLFHAPKNATAHTEKNRIVN